MAAHSLVRHLIPFSVQTTAPRAIVYRKVLMEYPFLIDMHFNSLLNLPVDATPRKALVQALQKLLDSSVPQRDVRGAYLEAERICRLHLLRYSDLEAKQDPYVRFVYCQLVAVATYYSMLFGIDDDGRSFEHKAATLLRAYAMSEVVKDPLFNRQTEFYEKVDRRVLAPYRENKLSEAEAAAAKAAVLQQMPPQIQSCIREMWLWERDLLGIFRLDKRQDTHMVFHRLKLEEEVGHDENSAVFLYDPLLEEFGNLVIQREKIKNGRWYEYRVMANVEDHRISDELPPCIELPIEDTSLSSSSSSAQRFFAFFDKPICPRSYAEITQRVQEKPVELRFETPILDNSNMTFFEKFFQREY